MDNLQPLLFANHSDELYFFLFQPVVIKTEVPSLSPVSHGQHLDGKLLPYDLGDLSDKLDNALQVIKPVFYFDTVKILTPPPSILLL